MDADLVGATGLEPRVNECVGRQCLDHVEVRTGLPRSCPLDRPSVCAAADASPAGRRSSRSGCRDVPRPAPCTGGPLRAPSPFARVHDATRRSARRSSAPRCPCRGDGRCPGGRPLPRPRSPRAGQRGSRPCGRGRNAPPGRRASRSRPGPRPGGRSDAPHPLSRASPLRPGALDVEEQQEHSDRDREVGQVEGRPQRHADEVGDRAVADPVGEVPERAADQQRGRQPDQPPGPTADGEEDRAVRAAARPSRR